MKKMFILLVFCLLGCNWKSEQELKTLKEETTKVQAQNEMIVRELNRNNAELDKTTANLKRAWASLNDANERLATAKNELVTLHDHKHAQTASETKGCSLPIQKRTVHILKVKIKQRSYSLNPFTHIKNAINAMEVEIPVDEEYFKHHKIGDELSTSFRLGSAILHGAVGEVIIEVTGKRVTNY